MFKVQGCWRARLVVHWFIGIITDFLNLDVNLKPNFEP